MDSSEEPYRGFIIKTSIVEKPTTWVIDVRVGTKNGDKLILEPEIPPTLQEFNKKEGALNSALAMANDAKAKIDEHLEA